MLRRRFIEAAALTGLPSAFPAAEGRLDPPLHYRLRGTESRPLFTDVEAYVKDAVRMRCNVMTIGPMNGRHFTAFATKAGVPYSDMHPDFIPRLVKSLHEQNIAAIGWLPFNVQDLKTAEECEAAKKYPQWRMEYLEWPGRSSANKAGMCVLSSPWRNVHAGILKEAAALGIDGVFFDGFYLSGIPHPTSPGCVCRYCRESFQAEMKSDVPKRVDWTDPNFKRWVRWRNRKLVEVAGHFIRTMREANPNLQVTCNYNTWPFGDKDWDTAVPLWAAEEWGVSQHGYTGREDLEWIMVGYKARLSHDMNPHHSDLWRTSAPAWKYEDSPDDRARHELTMRTFMLGAMVTGTTPWHGGHIKPEDVHLRVHDAVAARERFFSTEELRHGAVLISQNTHDYYGHIPGTENLGDYRDTILGTWLLLAEQHATFRFVFDNQLKADQLRDYKVLLLPNAACLSDESAAELKRYVEGGGKLIVTGNTGAYDEWGNKRRGNALEGIKGLSRLEGEPALKWVRTRDRDAARRLLGAFEAVPAPYTVEAAPSLFVSPCWAPGRKSLWLHLLNVSAFYPGGDTGFRGMAGTPAYSGPAASDAQIAAGGKLRRTGRPEKGIFELNRSLNVKSARLGVSGAKLRIDTRRRIILPEIETHDVLILDV